MDGLILKNLIKRSGLTQDEFAQKVGASRSTIILLTQKGVISDEWKKRICDVLNVATDVWTGKESTQYSINTDPSHILTANERQALWDIIQAQKDVIDNLRRQLKDTDDSKD